jgi:hypothetical protein
MKDKEEKSKQQKAGREVKENGVQAGLCTGVGNGVGFCFSCASISSNVPAKLAQHAKQEGGGYSLEAHPGPRPRPACQPSPATLPKRHADKR